MQRSSLATISAQGVPPLIATQGLRNSGKKTASLDKLDIYLNAPNYKCNNNFLTLTNRNKIRSTITSSPRQPISYQTQPKRKALRGWARSRGGEGRGKSRKERRWGGEGWRWSAGGWNFSLLGLSLLWFNNEIAQPYYFNCALTISFLMLFSLKMSQI